MSNNPTSPLLSVIRQLALGEDVASADVTDAFELVMSGDATPAQIAALLIGLRVKGETAAEVAGVARALRRVMIRLPSDRPEELVDTCGTGGGAVATFNISTAAALLAAGAGVRVAKHGNRSFTSLCGSADVLEALGVSIDASIDVMTRALRDAGVVFMFAPLMHPAMRHVGSVRRELAIPTVMNIVGPLANPALAGRQVIGVADENRLPLIAGALQDLGTAHALLVYGSPGMDEISPLGPTRVIELREGTVRHWWIDPARYGCGAQAGELRGGSSALNAQIVLSVLEGNGSPGAAAAVILNAAAAIYVSGTVTSFDAAIECARAAIGARAGVAALDRLRAAFAVPAPR